MSNPIKLQRLFLSQTSFLSSSLSLALTFSLISLFLKFKQTIQIHWPTSEEQEQILEELYSSDGGIGEDDDDDDDDDDGDDDGDDSERPKKLQIDCTLISWNQSIQQQEQQHTANSHEPSPPTHPSKSKIVGKKIVGE